MKLLTLCSLRDENLNVTSGGAGTGACFGSGGGEAFVFTASVAPAPTERSGVAVNVC